MTPPVSGVSRQDGCNTKHSYRALVDQTVGTATAYELNLIQSDVLNWMAAMFSCHCLRFVLPKLPQEPEPEGCLSPAEEGTVGELSRLSRIVPCLGLFIIVLNSMITADSLS